jgi:hypothetical protein
MGVYRITCISLGCSRCCRRECDEEERREGSCSRQRLHGVRALLRGWPCVYVLSLLIIPLSLARSTTTSPDHSSRVRFLLLSLLVSFAITMSDRSIH